MRDRWSECGNTTVRLRFAKLRSDAGHSTHVRWEQQTNRLAEARVYNTIVESAPHGSHQSIGVVAGQQDDWEQVHIM
eukprot:6492669-Amphidinium_carterae.2